MAIERRIKTLERQDGKARLHVIARDDGLFRYEGECETDEGDGHGLFWCPCDCSGLFASESEAEQAARRDVAWLRYLDAAITRTVY